MRLFALFRPAWPSCFFTFTPLRYDPGCFLFKGAPNPAKGLALVITLAGWHYSGATGRQPGPARCVTLPGGCCYQLSLFDWDCPAAEQHSDAGLQRLCFHRCGPGDGLLALSRGQASLNFNLDAWLAIIALGIFATVLAMAAFFPGIKEIGASRAAIISTFEPAATAILLFLSWGSPDNLADSRGL